MAATKKVAHKNIAFMSDEEFYEFLELCRTRGLSEADISAIIERDNEELMGALDFIDAHRNTLHKIFSKNSAEPVDKSKNV